MTRWSEGGGREAREQHHSALTGWVGASSGQPGLLHAARYSSGSPPCPSPPTLLLQYEGYIDEKLGVEAPAPAQTVSAAVPAPAQ